jgi:hypothetical protein
MNGIIDQLVKVRDIQSSHERKGCLGSSIHGGTRSRWSW